MHIAVAAQFEKDSANLPDKIKGKIRCGFEAEFASCLSRDKFHDKLSEDLPHYEGDINVSDRYGASHDSDYTQWSIEYDNSIPTDDSFREKIECVSPIQGLDETIRDMGIVFGLIERYGKTSQGTGLHMTFSLEDIDLFDWGFNPIKFLFLVGEDYYARLFGRQNYHYASEIIARALKHITDFNSTARVTLSDCSNALNAISRHYTERPTNGDLIGTRYDNESDALSSSARVVSGALRHAMDEMNRTNSLNMTKLRNRSCVEFRLPGGAGYENKFEQCSRLMRIIANALWASMAGKVDYNDYVAKKLFRYVIRAQAKATEGDEKPFVKLKSSEHIEGDSKVYQLTELSKFKGQTPQKTPLLTVTVKGNQITNITSTASEHTDIEDTQEIDTFVGSLAVTPAMALSVLSNSYLFRKSPVTLIDACSRSLGIYIEANPGSVAFDVLKEHLPLYIESVESLGSIKRVAAKYVLLHLVTHRATAFAGPNYVQELTDNEFLLNVGKLVKIAEPLLERPTLLFFKFWVWAKLDKSLLTDDIADLYNTIAFAPRLNQAGDQSTQACIKLAERLANPRYRSLLPSFIALLADYRGSSMRDLVAYMFEQPVSYKSIREPDTLAKFLVDFGVDGDLEAAYTSLGASGFKSLFSTMTEGAGGTSPADSITSGSTSSRISQTLLKKLNTLDRVSSIRQGVARDTLRTLLVSNITQHPDQPSSPAATTLRTMQNGIDHAVGMSMSSLADLLRTATDADLEPYKSDAAVAAGVTYSTALLFRAGVVCKFSPVFAKMYKSQPVWSAALLCLTAASQPYNYYEKNIPLFGLKPEAALRSMLQHFPGNARYVNTILSTFRPTGDHVMYARFLDVASFLQQFPELPMSQAFGKGMLDLFLQFAALKLSSAGPFGSKRSYYMFDKYRYELDSLTGTLPPLLDYLAGQKVAGKDIVHGGKQSITMFNWKADSDGTEYSKSGPYFKYKVPKETALGWLNHAQVQEQPEAFDDSHTEDSADVGPAGDEATHKMAQFTNWGELADSDYQHFVANASVDDIKTLFHTTSQLHWKDQRHVLMDFLSFSETSANPNLWTALTAMLQSRMLDNMVRMLIDQQIKREICNNALFYKKLSDTRTIYGKPLPTLINSMLDMASGDYRVMWGMFNSADSYGYSDVLMVVSALPDLFEKAPKTARLLLGNRLIASDLASKSNKTLASLKKEIAKLGSRAPWVLKGAVSIPFRNPVCDLVIQALGYSEVSTQLSTLPSEAAPYPWRQALGV